MLVPVAALYDVSLRIHQIAGLGLIVIAVAITVLSVLSRNQDGVLEKGLPLAVIAGPLFGLVLLTGAYQLFKADISFFQVWVIGALLLGIGFMGVLHGTWRPKARQVIDGELSGEALEKAKQTLIAVGASMIVMVIVATYLMENNS